MHSMKMRREKSLTTEPEMPMFPSVYVDHKQMPDIEDWEVGKEYTIKNMKMRMASKEMSEGEEGKRHSARMELMGYDSEKKHEGKTEKHLD